MCVLFVTEDYIKMEGIQKPVSPHKRRDKFDRFRDIEDDDAEESETENFVAQASDSEATDAEDNLDLTITCDANQEGTSTIASFIGKLQQ